MTMMAEAHFKSGAELQSQGRLDEAAACYHRALECDPGYVAAHCNLAVVLKLQGRLDEAVARFERAVELQPGYAQLHYNLGNTYTLLDQLGLAEAAYRRALVLAPTSADTHNNLANVLQVQGRFREARHHFDAALAAQPDLAEAHRNRALLRLLEGDYAEGWPEYEWRWRVPSGERPSLGLPRWQGQPLAGRTLLMWGEQGLGDVIQMVRYAPLVQERWGARVVVQCQPRLHPLLAAARGIEGLVAHDTRPEGCDFFAPMFSLPEICGTRVATIPAVVPYLFAEPARIARWRDALAGPDFKVGIAWQGNPGVAGDHFRSVPLEHFARLADCPGVRLFSLQKGPGREQLPALGPAVPIVDLADSLDEDGGAFADTAAAMRNLDLVVTSDTAIAHLAGALGVRAWVALQIAPNWRWLLDRDDSPWYPTLRLFRQTRAGDWAAVFERIAVELRALSSRSPVG